MPDGASQEQTGWLSSVLAIGLAARVPLVDARNDQTDTKTGSDEAPEGSVQGPQHGTGNQPDADKKTATDQGLGLGRL